MIYLYIIFDILFIIYYSFIYISLSLSLRRPLLAGCPRLWGTLSSSGTPYSPPLRPQKHHRIVQPPGVTPVLGRPGAPKIAPKSYLNFDSFLTSFLLRFWLHFEAQNAPETTSEKKRERKTRKREIALPLNVFPCFLGPTWSRNGPKMMPNTCQEACGNDVGKMIQKRHQKYLKMTPKTNQK